MTEDDKNRLVRVARELSALAQNDHMVNQFFTDTGKELNRAAEQLLEISGRGLGGPTIYDARSGVARLDATVVARAFEVMLPAHAAELALIHNEHKSYYRTVKETLEDDDLGKTVDELNDFVTAVERQKAIETNELWELRWYPDTPVGFCRKRAASLPALAAWLQNHGLAFGS
jgi:hypothetical protein